MIRLTIEQLKQKRHITPKVLYVRSGTKEESYFDLLLLEEQTQLGPSFSQFLEQMQTEVAKFADHH